MEGLNHKNHGAGQPHPPKKRGQSVGFYRHIFSTLTGKVSENVSLPIETAFLSRSFTYLNSGKSWGKTIHRSPCLWVFSAGKMFRGLLDKNKCQPTNQPTNQPLFEPVFRKIILTVRSQPSVSDIYMWHTNLPDLDPGGSRRKTPTNQTLKEDAFLLEGNGFLDIWIKSFFLRYLNTSICRNLFLLFSSKYIETSWCICHYVFWKADSDRF